ncbi:hypothetical protein AMJ51_02610 [Microgenomates bacterium DG_75]|nr:MAG: hypothetical protein AMJ51_02610 [Microgenomates bacterium DG_75]
MKDCLFCQFARGKDSPPFVYEDNDFIAFNDINPIAPVHILIVPKKHIDGIQTIEKEDQAILGKMFLVARKIAEKEKLKGYKLFINCGKLGGQAIFHLHLHLVGGWKTQKGFFN